MTALRWLPRFREAYRAMGEYAARERWNRAAIQAYQLERLNCLWSRAVRHVPHYRNLAATANLPVEFQNLDEFCERVPCLPKQAVRDNTASFLSERAEAGSWLRTGGSTGPPTRLFVGNTAHREMLQAKYRFYADWGLDIFDRFAFLWGHSASFAPGLKGLSARLRQPAVDWLRNRRRLSVYHLGRDRLRRHLRRIERFAPAALYGYASAVYALAREAIEGEFRNEALKAVIMTSEPTFSHMAEIVSQAFSAPVVIEYGAAECGLIAAQAGDGTLRVREDLVLLETLPRGDGSYDIAVTVLNNPSFPLVRYMIGDVTRAPVELPDGGFGILEAVEGRCNDFVCGRTGELIHPAYLIELLKQSGEIGRYQVWQKRDGSIRVVLETRGAPLQVDLPGLVGRLREAVGGYAVEVAVADMLPSTPSGKHRWICSELTAPLGLNHTKASATPSPAKTLQLSER